jgi:hypothetical protein
MNVRAPNDQFLGNARLMRRCGHMQGRIARVDVVPDLVEKVLFCGLPSRTAGSALSC